MGSHAGPGMGSTARHLTTSFITRHRESVSMRPASTGSLGLNYRDSGPLHIQDSDAAIACNREYRELGGGGMMSPTLLGWARRCTLSAAGLPCSRQSYRQMPCARACAWAWSCDCARALVLGAVASTHGGGRGAWGLPSSSVSRPPVHPPLHIHSHHPHHPTPAPSIFGDASPRLQSSSKRG